MSTFEAKTRIFQSFRGDWTGETRRSDCGKDWLITTSKRSNGQISSWAQAVNDDGDGAVSYMVFGNDKDRINLGTVVAKATEKAVRDAHYKALADFDLKVQSGELGSAKDVYKIELGQILFTEYQCDQKDMRAVCELLGRGRYKSVMLDGSGFRHDEHVRDYRDKFGIGVYYNEGEKISETELADLVITAHENVERKRLQDQAGKAIADAHRAAMIEAGAKVLPCIPAGVQAVIVGNLKQDESDIYTDYFASRSTKTVYLAFSSHKKNLFPEFRKAAANCPDTEFLATADDDHEHRDDYSGGHGYWLGEHRHYGWEVTKDCYRVNLEDIQIAIGEGRCFIPFDVPGGPGKSGETTAIEGVQVIDYSDKALAVIGETYPIRAMLKEQGGRFNKFLKIGGQTVAGWIFQKSNPPKFA